MVQRRGVPLRALQYSHLLAVLIYLASWVYLPAVCLWGALLLWAGYAWYQEREASFKPAYLSLIQAVALHIGLQLAAFASLLVAGKYNHGGLFSAHGQQNFGNLLIFALLGAVLALVATLWPALRLVKSYRALVSIQQAGRKAT